MQKRYSIPRIFALFAGAILLAAALTPLSLRLFTYATSFSVFPGGDESADPTLPYQFTVLAPLAGLVAGALFGALWAWLLSRLPQKEGGQNPLGLRVWIGAALLLPPLVMLLIPGLWSFVSDILPENSPFLLAVLWWIGLCCYFVWLIRAQPVSNENRPSGFRRILPPALCVLLLLSVGVCMLTRVYPVSLSIVMLLQGSSWVNFAGGETPAAFVAYGRYLPAAVHPVVVGSCAFLLSGWLTARKHSIAK